MSAPLRVEGLRKRFPTPAEDLVVLDDVSFEVPAGGSLAIMGPSGSGKSTLLHILGTLERPSSGRVELGGEDPFALPAGQLAAFRGRRVGFVFQDHHLLPQLTALENVLVPLLPRGAATSEGEGRARALLARVGLENRLEHFPAELSGGERQRVAIARALVTQPMLLLCDEPTGNLDARSAAGVVDLFLEVHRQDGKALVLVTHSKEVAARFDRTAELRNGRLAAPGSA